MDSPSRKSTSRVIDGLHSEIDALKTELEELKISHSALRKKNDILTTRNDSFVDQLANSKHENDMIGALLKRKERRIQDLETQFDDVASTNESLKLSNKNMKIRCDNLQESLASSTAEYERLKIAYDALIASQNEYKRHYQNEFDALSRQLDEYKRTSAAAMEELSSKLTSNDKDVEALLDSLSGKRRLMDNLYVNKNRAILELLVALAKAAKAHGEESKSLLLDSVTTISSLKEKYPDLAEKVQEHSGVEVDLDDLLKSANENISITFSDSESLGSDSDKQQRSTSSNRRRRNNNNNSNNSNNSKRNLMRLSSNELQFDRLDPPVSETLPKQRNSRNTSTSPTRNVSSASRNRSGQRSNRNSQVFSLSTLDDKGSAGANRGKRRLFYGGSNNFNSGGFQQSHERKISSQHERKISPLSIPERRTLRRFVAGQQ